MAVFPFSSSSSDSLLSNLGHLNMQSKENWPLSQLNRNNPEQLYWARHYSKSFSCFAMVNRKNSLVVCISASQSIPYTFFFCAASAIFFTYSHFSWQLFHIFFFPPFLLLVFQTQSLGFTINEKHVRIQPFIFL